MPYIDIKNQVFTRLLDLDHVQPSLAFLWAFLQGGAVVIYQNKSIKTAISTIESSDWQQFVSQLRSSDLDSALDICQTANRKPISNTCWNLGLAWTFFAKGDQNEALTLINQAAQSAPEHPIVRHSLALVHAASGNHQQAINSVGRLYQQLPEPQALELLDEVENICDTAKHRLLPKNYSLITSFTNIEWMLPALKKHIGQSETTSTPIKKNNLNKKKPSLIESQTDRSTNPIDQQISKQVSKLFGQSLFGSWIDPNQLIASNKLNSDKKALRYSRVTIMMIAVIITLFTLIILAGLDRRASETRSRIVEDIRAFLQDGNLTNAELYLKQIAAPLSDNSYTPDTPFADLTARTEATLYRFVDANPERLTRIRILLKSNQRRSPDIIIARALIAPSIELPDMIDDIESLAGPDNRDPEVLFLLATALDRSDNVSKAIQTFDRSEDLGPYHLPHLERISEFLIRRGRFRKAVKVIDRMIDINPKSPWTLVAEARNRILGRNSNYQIDTDSPKPAFLSNIDLPPVLEAEKHFILAFVDLKNDQTINAREHIQTACLKIYQQPTFLLDYFVRLLDENQHQAADLLRASSHWPINRPSALVATEKLEQIMANRVEKESTY